MFFFFFLFQYWHYNFQVSKVGKWGKRVTRTYEWLTPRKVRKADLGELATAILRRQAGWVGLNVYLKAVNLKRTVCEAETFSSCSRNRRSRAADGRRRIRRPSERPRLLPLRRTLPRKRARRIGAACSVCPSSSPSWHLPHCKINLKMTTADSGRRQVLLLRVARDIFVNKMTFLRLLSNFII